MWEYAHEYWCPQRLEEHIGYPGAEVPGRCNLSDVGSGISTLILLRAANALSY